MNDSFYYDYNRTNSYHALFNFIVGVRGKGKTYGFLKQGVKRFLKRGEQFIYLRRYETEVKSVRARIMDAVKNDPEFKGHEIAVVGKNIQVDKQTAGVIIPLSTSGKFKSDAFPRVTSIGFDEFIVDKGFIRYIRDEVTLFLEFYKTVDRDEDRVTCYFMANNVSSVNPYFNYWRLSVPDKEYRTFRNGLILVHNCRAGDAFIDRARSTRFGSLIEGTQYEAYSLMNESLRDSATFIEKRPKGASCIFNIQWGGRMYGLWRTSEFMLYLSDKFNANMFTYSLTTEDHELNTLLIRNVSRSYHLRLFREAYELGRVRFESQKIKEAGTDIYLAIRGT